MKGYSTIADSGYKIVVRRPSGHTQWKYTACGENGGLDSVLFTVLFVFVSVIDAVSCFSVLSLSRLKCVPDVATSVPETGAGDRAAEAGGERHRPRCAMAAAV